MPTSGHSTNCVLVSKHRRIIPAIFCVNSQLKLGYWLHRADDRYGYPQSNQELSMVKGKVKLGMSKSVECDISLCALTLWVGRQERHTAVKSQVFVLLMVTI